MAKYPEIAILSDEIYEHLTYDGKHCSIASFDNVKDQTIVLNGVSKAYAMTGWRIGFMGAPADVAKAVRKLQSQTTSGTCSIAQRAALEALTGDQTIIAKNNEVLIKRRDLMVKSLKAIPGVKFNVPPATFYCFPDFSAYIGKSFNGKKLANSFDFCDYLLNEAHVACVAGGAFGVDECIRMSYVVGLDRIEEAFKRINKALAHLK